MRLRPASAAALAATALLTGCVSQSVAIRGSVVLAADGRAEGSLELPEGGEAAIVLRNEGPGRADFVVRGPEGEVLQQGTLGDATVRVASPDPRTFAIVLESYEDAGTSVTVSLTATGRVRLGWRTTRPQPAAK